MDKEANVYTLTNHLTGLNRLVPQRQASASEASHSKYISGVDHRLMSATCPHLVEL